tara:strand:- start:39375 stop:39773 length:399 start_codon:yes stop_codon:yes gene_type:complete
MNRKILIASFIFPERLEWFISYLESKFDIPKEHVFVFQNLDDESKFIVTFKFKLSDKKVNFKHLFPNAILIHKRGNAIYTINALNKLIESECDGELGNINYKSIKIDWDKYQNKILLYNNNELRISNIKRIF